MKPSTESDPRGIETQPKEPLTINQVLDSVYDQLIKEFGETKVIRQFDNEFFEWDSFHDINGTRHISFELSGALFEIEENIGLLIVKSGERESSWFSSLIKVVAWTKLEIGGDGKYKVQIKDYPSWDELPTKKMISALPKSHSERSFLKGGLLVNQGQRLALNHVIQMQPRFVAQKEALDPNVIRGPGGVPILLDKSRGKTDGMSKNDVVTSGSLYKPEIVSYLIGQIKEDFV